MDFPRRFFVTGSDTGVGKTVVSAILVRGLRAAYWKPVQAGLSSITDTEWIKQVTELPSRHFFPETYRLTSPLSPHAAAELEGINIDLDQFQPPHGPLIIEGAGGLLVPLNEKEMMVHLIKKFSLPVLLVVKSGLGTINHTLLSLAILEKYAIPLLGVVMNGPQNESNRRAIEHFGKVAIIAEIEPLKDFSAASLEEAFHRYFRIDLLRNLR